MKFFYIIICFFNISFASFIDEYTFKIYNGECTEVKRFDRDSLKYDLLYRMAYIKNSNNIYTSIFTFSNRKETFYFKNLDECKKIINTNLR